MAKLLSSSRSVFRDLELTHHQGLRSFPHHNNKATIIMASDMKEKELSEEELLEIAEYEKVIRFRDRIFADTHPRIKVPPEVCLSQILF